MFGMDDLPQNVHTIQTLAMAAPSPRPLPCVCVNVVHWAMVVQGKRMCSYFDVIFQRKIEHTCSVWPIFHKTCTLG